METIFCKASIRVLVSIQNCPKTVSVPATKIDNHIIVYHLKPETWKSSFLFFLYFQIGEPTFILTPLSGPVKFRSTMVKLCATEDVHITKPTLDVNG